MASKSEVKQEPFESSNARQSTNTFEFETESLPLKGNSDYLTLLNHLNMLTALRTQSVEDINKVLHVQDKALSDPLQFIKKLQNGEDIGIPDRLVIPEMPEIDWSKYTTQTDAFRCTRLKTRDVNLDVKTKTLSEEEVVRGRLKDNSKPETFNKLWSPEEQFRLEELLIKYPPERNEARRFAKIAEELGNRTLRQVTSRCQKYFVKLAQKGLPVPGRVPRVKKDFVKNPKYTRPPQSVSTFFPRSFVPFSINDDGDLPGTSAVYVNRVKMEPIESDDSCDVADSESRKILLLRRVRADIQRHGDQKVTHAGYSCNICKEEPLRGTRWHCMECPDTDFCSKCLISHLETDGPEPHPLSHSLASYRPSIASNGDKDYFTDPNQYHYLDVNFRPD